MKNLGEIWGDLARLMGCRKEQVHGRMNVSQSVTIRHNPS